MNAPLRFGILATGSIAGEMAAALAESERCSAHAVGSRDPERAREFAARHSIPVAAESYEAVLADPEVDVVYVATPHIQHQRWTLAAIEAGKHVLCEKPVAINAAGAERVFDAAARAGVFALEAFAYRFHPQTDLLRRLIAERAVGTVRAVDVTFSYGGRPPSSYHLVNDLAGGGILDVGCYCTSMAALVAATAQGRPSVEAEELVGLAVFEEEEATDEFAAATVRFPGPVLGQLKCGSNLAQPDLVRVIGTEGYLETTQPCWLEGHRADETWIDVVRPGEEPVRHAAPGGTSIFAREVDGMAALLEGPPEARDAETAASLANMRALDRWRAAVGLRYRFE